MPLHFELLGRQGGRQLNEWHSWEAVIERNREKALEEVFICQDGGKSCWRIYKIEERKRKLVIAWLLAPWCYLFLTCVHILLIHAGNMSMKLFQSLYVFTRLLLLDFSLCLTDDRRPMTTMNGEGRKEHHMTLLLIILRYSPKIWNFVILLTLCIYFLDPTWMWV